MQGGRVGEVGGGFLPLIFFSTLVFQWDSQFGPGVGHIYNPNPKGPIGIYPI